VLAVSGKLASPDADFNLNSTSPIPAFTVVPGYPQHPHHALIAGFIGGYCVWGNYSSINYQIVLYLTSRVFVAMVKRLIRKQKGDLSSSNAIALIPQYLKDRTYTFCAAMIWGIVLFLYEDSPEVLHPSLKASMDEIYRFRPWSSLVPNSNLNIR
jgi:peroxisomal membrane protein 4